MNPSQFVPSIASSRSMVRLLSVGARRAPRPRLLGDETLALLPVRAAEAAALEGLGRAQDFSGAAPHLRVVHMVGPDHALVVDDHRGPVGDARVLLQDAEGTAHGMVRVREHRMRDLPWERLAVAEPGLVREERVGADADDVDLVVAELGQVLLEATDLRRA